MARNHAGLTWLFLAAIGLLITGSCMILGVPAQAQSLSPAFIAAPLQTLPDGPTDHAVGRLIVAFKSTTGTKQQTSVLSARGLSVVRRLDQLNISVVQVPAGQELSLAKELASLPTVRFAEPDHAVYALETPNDTYYGAYQWNLSTINAPAAWDVTTGAVDVTIAIADTGIDLNHPDLAGKIVPGYDFVHGDSIAQDDHGHGTHCAGIAAAITDNSLGIAGVNWNARLMPLKVLDSTGSGWDSDVASAIVWAVDHGASVVSLSLGGTDQSQAVVDAVNYAYAHDVVIVAAAGNEYLEGNPTIYPAAYEHVIGVSATGATDGRAYYSNTGFYVDVAAPGGDYTTGPRILSTYWASGVSTYAYGQGTSMATPHVAGLAALIQSLDSSLTSDEVEWIIESTAVDLGATGRDDVFGWGRINAVAALAAVNDPIPTPSPTPPPSCLAESAHPYANYINLTWNLVNPVSSAPYTRIHFYRLETEAGYDYVIVRDGSGTEIYRYDGSYPVGLWSGPVPGATVQVQLVSDYSVTGWGFCVDGVESDQAAAIRVSPDAIDRAVEQGASLQIPVTIYNDGSSTLTFSIQDSLVGMTPASDAAWITVSPASGSVPAGGQQTVTVNLSGVGLEVGEHLAQLSITSNDPFTSEWLVPVSVDVTMPNNVLLRFDPPASAVAQGMVFRVDMFLSAGSQSIDSVDAVVHFDPAILQVVDEMGNPASAILPGEASLMPLANQVDNGAGRISYGAVRPLGAVPPTGELHLATIRFRANAQTLSPAGTSLTFDSACEAYFAGLPVLDGSEPGSVIVQASWFTGRVTLQGHGAAPGDRWADYPLTVAFLDAAGQIVGQFSTTTDENGYLSILTSPSGTFDLKIKGAHTLSNLRESVVVPAGDIIDLGILREGDANNDDRVSGIDFSLLATAYATTPADARWDSRVDFNDDERVSAADFSLLASNYSLQGPLTVASDSVAGALRLTRTMALSMNPPRQIVGRDGVIEFDLILDTQNWLVDTVDVLLAFNPQILTVVDLDNRPADRIIPGDAFPVELTNLVGRDTGRIAYGAGISLGDEPVAGRLIVATVRLRALQHTRNGLQGTPLGFLPGTDAYLAGQPQLNARTGGIVVVSLTPVVSRDLPGSIVQ